MRAVVRRRLSNLGRFVLAGAEVGLAVGAVIHQIDGGELPPHLLRGALVGLVLGTLIGLGEEFVFVGRRIWQSYWRTTLLRIVAYTLTTLVVLVLVNGGWRWWINGTRLPEAVAGYLNGGTSRRDFVLAVTVALAGTSFIEIRRLHNPGDVVGFLVGRYRFPVPEKRIFLFVDLADSTGLAERLGPMRYSRFIGDCFRDMSEAILTWRGEVYQHVGDEVVISWPWERGLDDAACLECFLGIRERFDARSARYESVFGAAPRFRGALHGGDVVTTWVGLAKMELAFHGDALNVAARIQALSSARDEELLVSGALLEWLRLPPGVESRSLGREEFKGRENGLEVVALDWSAKT